MARWDRVRLQLRTPDFPDSMAATTEGCSSNDDILVVFSNIDAGLRSLATCSPAVSADPAVKFISPPASPSRHLPDQVSNDEPVSLDSISTIDASDNDPAVEASSTAGVLFAGDDSNEDQHKLSPPLPFQPIVAPFFRAPIGFNTAPRLSIQSTAANITTIFCFQTDSNYSATYIFPISLTHGK